MAKFLDYTGLTTFWNKIKSLLVNSHILLPRDFAAPDLHRGPNNVELNNAFWALDKRFPVTATRTNADGSETSVSVSTLFNGNYNNTNLSIPVNCSLKIHIQGNPTYINPAGTYSYGYYIVVFYYDYVPSDVSFRVYENYSSNPGWKTLTPNKISNSIYSFSNSYHNLSEIEIVIKARDSGRSTMISQLLFCPSRGTATNLPFLNKYGTQILYYDLTAPNFIGNLDGKLKTARTIQTNLGATNAASFDGSANVSPGVTGTLPIANGGTGATTALAAQYSILQNMQSDETEVSDDGTIVMGYSEPNNTKGVIFKRSITKVWDYFKNKIKTDLDLDKDNYSGTAAKATADSDGNNITQTYATKEEVADLEFAPKDDGNDTHDTTKFYRADGSWAVPKGGSGTVKSVNNLQPDNDGNVALTAGNVRALPWGGKYIGATSWTANTWNYNPVLSVDLGTDGTYKRSRFLLVIHPDNNGDGGDEIIDVYLGFSTDTSNLDYKRVILVSSPTQFEQSILNSNNFKMGYTYNNGVATLWCACNVDSSRNKRRRFYLLIEEAAGNSVDYNPQTSTETKEPNGFSEIPVYYYGVMSNSYNKAVGSSTRPVYVSDAGLVTAGTLYAGGTAVTLNGSSAAGSSISFYAPTSAGNDGLPLVWSGSRITTTQANTWGNVGSSGSIDNKQDMLLNTDIICNQSSKYTVGIKRLCNNRTYRFDLQNPSKKQVILNNNTNKDITVWYNSTSHSVTTDNSITLDGGSRSAACSAWVTIINDNIYVTYGY